MTKLHYVFMQYMHPYDSFTQGFSHDQVGLGPMGLVTYATSFPVTGFHLGQLGTWEHTQNSAKRMGPVTGDGQEPLLAKVGPPFGQI